jgi:hypothetical protein
MRAMTSAWHVVEDAGGQPGRPCARTGTAGTGRGRGECSQQRRETRQPETATQGGSSAGSG